jgi:transposase
VSEKVLYIGIDVSKLTLDAAITVDSKKILSIKKVNNNLSGFNALEDWAKKHLSKQNCSTIHFCLECTGVYSQDLVEFLQERDDFLVSVVNPAQIKAFSQTILLRTKTDKADCKMIAMYCSIIKPEATVLVAKEFKQLRELYRYLDCLKDKRAQEKTRIQSVKNPTVVGSIEETISYYNEQIKKIEKEIKKHIDKYPHLKEKIELLKTIPGVADTTAWMLLSEMNVEDGSGLLNPKSQTAHAGLSPRECQSGSSINGRPHICKTGNARLREGLYMPAVSAIRFENYFQGFYLRLVSNGKSKMVALVAVMRKILVTAVGVLRNSAPFDPDWAQKKSLNFN